MADIGSAAWDDLCRLPALSLFDVVQRVNFTDTSPDSLGAYCTHFARFKQSSGLHLNAKIFAFAC